jgi:cytoskeletal protein RodZ
VANIDITTTKVPNGTVDTDYSATINANGSCTPYTWAVAKGKLPAGITKKTTSSTTSLDLTGTPTTAATYTFTISVTGCNRQVAQASYEVVVQAAKKHVVDVSWDASKSKNIAGYNIYRAPDGVTWKKINTGLIASTDYDDSSVADGSTYYYSATSVDIYGEESKKTAAVKVSVPE